MSSVERRVAKLEAAYETEAIEHDAGQSLDELREYEGRPLAFFRDVLGVEPWEGKQTEAVETAALERQTVVLGCHAAGKEWLIARLALYFAYARGMLVILTSASERQVINQTWRELRAAFRKAPRLPGEALTNELRIPMDGVLEPRVFAMTYSTSIDRLTGWHDASGVAVLVSEGQGEDVDGGVLDAAHSTADERSRIVVAGNPVRPSGALYSIHKRDTWELVRISAFDHPNVREGRVVVPGGPAPDWPDRMATEYGKDSPYYIGRVLAEFPTTAIDALYDAEWVDAGVERWESGALERTAAGRAARLILDVARFGPDESVLGFMQGPVLRRFATWRGADLMATAHRVRKEARMIVDATSGPWLGVEDVGVVVDEVGVGGGAVDRLRELNQKSDFRFPVHGFNGGGRSRLYGKEAARFLNHRAAAHWAVRDQLQREDLAIPPDAKLREEMLAVTWTTTPKGQVQVQAKDELKVQLGHSPDRLDVLTMGAFIRGRGGPGLFRWKV